MNLCTICFENTDTRVKIETQIGHGPCVCTDMPCAGCMREYLCHCGIYSDPPAPYYRQPKCPQCRGNVSTYYVEYFEDGMWSSRPKPTETSEVDALTIPQIAFKKPPSVKDQRRERIKRRREEQQTQMGLDCVGLLPHRRSRRRLHFNSEPVEFFIL